MTDPKGEYDRLIGALGGAVLRLEPGADIQLNPLERIGSAEQRQALLHAVARAILARPLQQVEAVGLTAALAAVDGRAGGRQVCIPDGGGRAARSLGADRGRDERPGSTGSL